MNQPPVPSLPEAVRASLARYFADLGDGTPSHVYDMLVLTVEKPLLELVMEHAGHNQSKAALWLGLNRNTLRKKLLRHGLIDA